MNSPAYRATSKKRFMGRATHCECFAHDDYVRELLAIVAKYPEWSGKRQRQRARVETLKHPALVSAY